MLIVTIDEEEINIDEDFIGPVTQQVMRDPVTTADGHTYEREAIERWLQHNRTSPKTGLVLPHTQLQPNHFAKQTITKLLDKYPKLLETDEVYLPQKEAVLRYCKSDNAAALLERLSKDDVLLIRMSMPKEQNIWHMAAYYQAKKVLESLVDFTSVAERQPALLQRDTDGNTPLHLALIHAKESDLTMVNLLLNALSSLKKVKGFTNPKDREATQHRLNCGVQAAVIADSVTRIALFKRLGAELLLPYLVNNNENLLHLAVKKYAWEAASYLMDHMKLSINGLDKNGQSILYKAIDLGRLDQIKWILQEYNPKVNQLLSNGETVHHKAVTIVCPEKDRVVLIKLLLNKKANPNLGLKNGGTTSLQLVCMKGQLTTVQLLVKNGKANPLLQDQEGNTSFHLAIIHDQHDVLNYLLSNTESLIIPPNRDGNTILHLLAKKGNEAVLVRLLAKGMSYKLMNIIGETPLDIIKQAHPTLLPRISQVIADNKQKKRQALQEDIVHLQEKMHSQDLELETLRTENEHLLSTMESQQQIIQEQDAELRTLRTEGERLLSTLKSQRQAMQEQDYELKMSREENKGLHLQLRSQEQARQEQQAKYEALRLKNLNLINLHRSEQRGRSVQSQTGPQARAVGGSMSRAFQSSAGRSNPVEQPKKDNLQTKDNESCCIT